VAEDAGGVSGPVAAARTQVRAGTGAAPK
jgi:hypothetical protein